MKPATKRSATGLAGLFPLGVGALLASALIWAAFGGADTRFDEFALGQATTSVFASYDGRPIHCKAVADSNRCLDAAEERGLPHAALWLGNSQVHAVNQFQEGEENAPPILFRRLLPHHIDLLTFSEPNANLQEHYVLFEYLRSRLPLELLVLPVVFDDLRETGLRAEIAEALLDASTVEALTRTPIGQRIVNDNKNLMAGDADLAGVRKTVQEHSERALNGWLDRNFPLWAARAQARGRLFTGLYRLRNTVFGITAQTKRRLIRGPYEANMAALKALLGSASDHGIAVLVYVVPLRDDLEIPYDRTEYERFKEGVARVAGELDATFADFQSLVPAELWGQKGSTAVGGGTEVDFMHFQAGGHVLLARALGDTIENEMLEPER